MKNNSFGQGLIAFFVIVGVLFIIGSIGEASEPKCIKAGCDNKRASDSSIVICINHTLEAVHHHIAILHIAINHPAVLLKVVQAVQIQAAFT